MRLTILLPLLLLAACDQAETDVNACSYEADKVYGPAKYLAVREKANGWVGVQGIDAQIETEARLLVGECMRSKGWYFTPSRDRDTCPMVSELQRTAGCYSGWAEKHWRDLTQEPTPPASPPSSK